jgi:hypothetical protein
MVPNSRRRILGETAVFAHYFFQAFGTFPLVGIQNRTVVPIWMGLIKKIIGGKKREGGKGSLLFIGSKEGLRIATVG